MDRKKVIELILYIFIVIAGIAFLISNHFNAKETKHNLKSGGARNAVISVR
jgi:hypothetical protein